MDRTGFRKTPSASTSRIGSQSSERFWQGVTLTLEGDANDYVGKGLSAQSWWFIRPALHVSAGGNMLVGNVVLYGATSGSAFSTYGASGFAVRIGAQPWWKPWRSRCES